MTVPTARTIITRATLPLTLALVLLVFLVLMGACTDEEAAQENAIEPQPGDRVINRCDEWIYLNEILDVDPIYFDELWHRYIRWSPDGSQILFNNPSIAGGSLHSVTPDGTTLKTIATMPTYLGEDSLQLPSGGLYAYGGNMMYFDISPDSSRIAYSTCLYTRERPGKELDKDQYGDYYQVVPDIEGVGNSEQEQEVNSWVYNYEIVLADIDGTNVSRLTDNTISDNFPLWSPDGSKIAFMGGDQLTIYSVAEDRVDTIKLSYNDNRVVLTYPMVWSPNGEQLVGIASAWDTPYSLRRRAAYVAESDGSSMTQISFAASGPAWSPDGQRIALTVPVGEATERPRSTSDGIYHIGVGGVALYTFAADGSDPVLVADGDSLPAPKITPVDPWMWDLSWSPDGSEILFSGFGHRIPLDGSPSVDSNSSNYYMDAAWSPDGSRIAILVESGFSSWGSAPWETGVYVMDWDGTNRRTLVEVEVPTHWYDLPENAYELRLAE